MLLWMFNVCGFSESPQGDWLKDVDARVKFGLEFGKKRGFIQPNDSVVLVTGWKQGSGYTNTLRIMYENLEEYEL